MEEDVGANVLGERLPQAALPTRDREVLDESRRRGAVRVEAVLDGTVGDGHCKVRLPAARLPRQDETPALGHEVWREIRADKWQPNSRLIRKVELFDGLEEREAGGPPAALASAARWR